MQQYQYMQKSINDHTINSSEILRIGEKTKFQVSMIFKNGNTYF